MIRNEGEGMRGTSAAIASVLCVTQLISLAHPVSGEEQQLPGTYALADVSVEFSEGGPHGQTSVRIDGNGSGAVTSTSMLRQQPTEPFTVDLAAVFELLQQCYRGRFFDLQSSYGPPSKVRLGPNGRVDTLETIVADASWSTITVRIGSYTKSVGYMKGVGDLPPVLTDLERRITRAREEVESK
jgi:hypothetical protein